MKKSTYYFSIGAAILLSSSVAAYFKVSTLSYVLEVLLFEKFELVSLSVPFGYVSILASFVFKMKKM